MQFDGDPAFDHRHSGPSLLRPKFQRSICIISHSTHLLLHQPAKKWIDEVQDAFMAAKVLIQKNGEPLLFALRCVEIASKDGRIRLAEAVNALLDIAY